MPIATGCSVLQSPLVGDWGIRRSVGKPDDLHSPLVSIALGGPSVVLTLNKNGTGFLKHDDSCPQAVWWTAEKNQIVLSLSQPSRIDGGNSIVGTLTEDKKTMVFRTEDAMFALKKR